MLITKFPGLPKPRPWKEWPGPSADTLTEFSRAHLRHFDSWSLSSGKAMHAGFGLMRFWYWVVFSDHAGEVLIRLWMPASLREECKESVGLCFEPIVNKQRKGIRNNRVSQSRVPQEFN